MKKILSLLLTVITLFMCTCSTYAADVEPMDVPQLYWDSIATITNDLAVRNGTAEISVSVVATSSIDRITITSVLQKKSFVFFWSDKYIYESSFNTYYGVYEKDVPNIGAGTWRLKTTVRTYKQGVLQEEVTVYSED